MPEDGSDLVSFARCVKPVAVRTTSFATTVKPPEGEPNTRDQEMCDGPVESRKAPKLTWQACDARNR